MFLKIHNIVQTDHSTISLDLEGSPRVVVAGTLDCNILESELEVYSCNQMPSGKIGTLVSPNDVLNSITAVIPQG